MSNQEITQQAEVIRQHIQNYKLDKVFDLLVGLGKNVGQAFWDESINLNEDYSRLKNDIRKGLITSEEADIERNVLVENILNFLHKVEQETKGKNEKNIIPTIKEKEETQSSTSSNFLKIIIGLLSFIILGGLFFFFINKDEEPEETKSGKTCDELIIEGKTAFYKEEWKTARLLFSRAKSRCNNAKDADLWIEKIGKEENITKERSTTPEGNEDFRGLIKKGNAALKAKRYEKAFFLFEKAKSIESNIQISGKLEEARELCYRKFFSKGMDYYNVQNYEFALIEFKKAETYKPNFSQIKGMIKRCEDQM